MRALSTLACLRCNWMDLMGVHGRMTCHHEQIMNKRPACVVELTAYRSEGTEVKVVEIWRWWCRLCPKHIGHRHLVHRSTDELVDNCDCGSAHCELADALIGVFRQDAVIFGPKRKTVNTKIQLWLKK